MCERVQNTCSRFKGVENFLRRIAFNLGNTPSQTEIKIISCIPIDVTDLQQKICDLERLLRRIQKPPAIVHTALCENTTPKLPSLNKFNIIKEDPNPALERSNLSYNNIDIPEENNNIKISETKNNTEVEPRVSVTCIVDEDLKNEKTFFRKSKKKTVKKKHNKTKNHLVYYAHAESSPFNLHNGVKKKQVKKEKLNQYPNDSFFAHIIRKQYEPQMYKLSGESSFSSPVCRDVEQSNLTTSDCAIDICSCCDQDFVNIDNNKDESLHFRFTPTFSERIKSHELYYDSSLYDLVPVKEAPVKSKKNLDVPKKQQYKNLFNLPNFDYEFKPYVHPMCVNYHTIIPTKPKFTHSLPRRTPARKTRKSSNRRIDVRNVAEITQEDTSNSCRIECGNVYMKPAPKRPEPTRKLEIKKYPVTYNNAETATRQDMECQTMNTTQDVEIEPTPPDDKTEQTLNQIKTILQSVLTEVKTNTKVKNLPEQKPKKDAIVQKGTSFGNVPGSSRLLNSFTYSPYNVGPYAPPCSQPMSSGQYWPGMPYPKCLHNFPVFIQTPGRHGCASCFKKPSHISKPAKASCLATNTRNATSASTNTEEDRSQNQETETLIKQIYKSIALNIDVPKRDISTSNCSSALRRSSRTSTKSSYRSDKSVSARQITSNSLPQSLYRRAAPMNSGLTPFTSNMFSKLTSNTVSVQSHVMSSTDTDRRLRHDRLGHYLDPTQEMPSEESAERRLLPPERRPPSVRQGVPSDSSSEESDEEQNQGDYKAEVQKKERNSLFSKMINSVKMFKSRRRKSQKSKLESEDEVESNSDDYQTVYSQQVPRARKVPVMQTRKIPHSKVSYSRQMRGRNQEKLRRSPMEQEYRRQWNEQLMFQERPQYSSGRSERGHRNDPSGYYKQTFEARPVLVEQSVPARSFMTQDRPLVAPPRPKPPRPPLCHHPAAAKGIAWFRKRVRCGEHFKSLIRDN